MGYLALYRRFRPQGFDKLVGQDAVVRTLKNQIAEDRIGHAYLFCGARGTGKTSAAKIFARAINCTSPVNGSPCGKCAACVALSGSNIDVVEMDAASNNKVEEVRDIRENVQYPPVSCRYKVYIIDEVHMLTDSAFNALLKTLEEPPKHAVFVLATTEPQKLPATILSRCMRFDFKLIETPVIASLVADIYREVGKDFEEEAVYAIAKAGNGSVRDALSVADVCLSCGEGKLTYRDVTEVLGAADRDKTAQLVRALLEGKEGDALFSIDHLVKSGKNVFLLAKDTVGVLRDLLVIKNCTTAAVVLNYPAEELTALTELAALADAKRIVRMVEIFTELDGKMRYSASPRVMLEAAALKAARPETDFDMAALLFRVNALTDEVAKLKEELATAKTLAAQAPVMQQPMQAPVMQTAQAESLRQDEPARELAPTVEENHSAPTEEPVQTESK
ncbi:MAG: DNA polymerase III subunit gamma/tau, partial [Clostridia bacterium]|nr:DNA polymerase III subunit gamma/tau [Clostridia bacterium]